jgi:hypothetical protein
MFWTEFLTTFDPSAPWFINKSKRVLRGTDGKYAVSMDISMDIVQDYFSGNLTNAGKVKANQKYCNISRKMKHESIANIVATWHTWI